MKTTDRNEQIQISLCRSSRGVSMTAMIIVFLFILKDVSSKNQSQNDRLLEYVMKSSERQNVIVQQPASAPSNDAAPTAGNGFTSVGEPKAGGDKDYPTWSITAEMEIT